MRSDSNNDLRVLAPSRELAPHETAVLRQLLDSPFRGRDEIRAQLTDARVVAEGSGDTRTIRFKLGRGMTQPAPTTVRVPVEGEALDTDGATIAVLLHVIDGHADELEIYRTDGGRILRDVISDLRTVLVNEER
jgi:hypothetical protein